jgi:hypothetical protein
VYRNASVAGFRGGFLLLAAAVLLGGLALYYTHIPPGSDGFSEGTASLLGVAGLVLAGFGITNIRSAIITGPDGVTIRTATGRRQRVPWAEVSGFELIPASRYSPRSGPRVMAVAVIRQTGARGTAGPGGRRRHGGRPPLYCPGSSFWSPSPRARQMIDDLQGDRQTWLTQHRRPATGLPSAGPLQPLPGRGDAGASPVVQAGPRILAHQISAGPRRENSQLENARNPHAARRGRGHTHPS